MPIEFRHDVSARTTGNAIEGGSAAATARENAVIATQIAAQRQQQQASIAASMQQQAASQQFQGEQRQADRNAAAQSQLNQYGYGQWQTQYQTAEFDRRRQAELQDYEAKGRLEAAGYKEKLSIQQQARKSELQQAMADIQNPIATPHLGAPDSPQRKRMLTLAQSEAMGIRGNWEPDRPDIHTVLKNNSIEQPDGTLLYLDHNNELQQFMPAGKKAENELKVTQAKIVADQTNAELTHQREREEKIADRAAKLYAEMGATKADYTPEQAAIDATKFYAATKQKSGPSPIFDAVMGAVGFGQLPRPTTPVEYAALESGMEYIAPDGSRRTKK